MGSHYNARPKPTVKPMGKLRKGTVVIDRVKLWDFFDEHRYISPTYVSEELGYSCSYISKCIESSRINNEALKKLCAIVRVPEGFFDYVEEDPEEENTGEENTWDMEKFKEELHDVLIEILLQQKKIAGALDILVNELR